MSHRIVKKALKKSLSRRIGKKQKKTSLSLSLSTPPPLGFGFLSPGLLRDFIKYKVVVSLGRHYQGILLSEEQCRELIEGGASGYTLLAALLREMAE